MPQPEFQYKLSKLRHTPSGTQHTNVCRVSETSIFRDMCETQSLDLYEYRALLAMLQSAIDRQFVQEIPVPPDRPSYGKRWFRDIENGQVYALDPPDEKSAGDWAEVEPEMLFPEAVMAKSNQTKN